jgi:hypothetical protein
LRQELAPLLAALIQLPIHAGLRTDHLPEPVGKRMRGQFGVEFGSKNLLRARHRSLL